MKIFESTVGYCFFFSYKPGVQFLIPTDPRKCIGRSAACALSSPGFSIDNFSTRNLEAPTAADINGVCLREKVSDNFDFFSYLVKNNRTDLSFSPNTHIVLVLAERGAIF